MPPEVDADALVRDAIDTTIAGLRAGAPDALEERGPGERNGTTRWVEEIMGSISHAVCGGCILVACARRYLFGCGERGGGERCRG